MDLRFLTDEGETGAVFRNAVQRDIDGSRLSWKYRLYYRAVRPVLPLAARQLLQGRRRADATPRGHYPDRFMEDLAHALERDGGVDLVHPWPQGRDIAFALTHDVESEAGLRRCIELANIEEDHGFRSSFNIVPFGYPIDPGITGELAARGFEVGLHGYNHDGRLFESKGRFKQRSEHMNRALKSYGAVGFRSPMAHRNLEWMQELDIDYDGSCFDADPFQAMAGGVGMVWPFIAGRFVELPYTLPQDHTVFIVLGERNPDSWRRKLEYLRACSGLASMLTHPDYLDSSERLGAYSELLAEVAEQGNVWHELPREVARWWRLRDGSRVERTPDGAWIVTGPAASEGAVPAHLMPGGPPPGFRWELGSLPTGTPQAPAPPG